MGLISDSGLLRDRFERGRWGDNEINNNSDEDRRAAGLARCSGGRSLLTAPQNLAQQRGRTAYIASDADITSMS